MEDLIALFLTLINPRLRGWTHLEVNESNGIVPNVAESRSSPVVILLGVTARLAC